MSLKKGRQALVLHACKEHGFRGLVRNEDGGADLINGRIVEDGQPIAPDEGLYALRFSQETGIATVETVYEPRKGPSKANSKPFRTGYEAIFGPSKREKELLN